jgi:TolB-like protein
LRVFAELKRRNVIRMAGLYLVGAWLIVQVASTLLPTFDAPAWVMKVLVALLATGFLAAIVFSWLYELTPDGLKRDSEVTPKQSIATQTARRMDRLFFAGLIALIAVIAADRWWPRQSEVPRVAVATPTSDANSASEPLPQPSEAVSPAPEPGERSVAVLPFVNMSNDPEQEYFSDGIAEELLNRLAKMPDLQVAARTSAFRFKGQNLDIADIGRQLRVVHVLEGSVRKAGIKLRITAQLIDSRSGYHLWSESYDRDATDVFRVQDEIAGEIARALKAKLGAPSDTASSAGKAVPEAYDDYLLGRSFVAKRFQENLHQAIAAFDRAIARDPQFAAAHSGRAFAQLLLPMWGSGEARLRLREAQTSAARALELDPDHAEALMVRGMATLFSYRAKAARVDLERALALAPNSADILNLYGDFLTQTGALGDAERIKRAAMLRDPLAMVHPLNLADIMIAQGRLAEALVFAEQAHALGGGAYALDRVVIAQTLLGRPTEAATTTETACALEAPIDRGCSMNPALVLAAEGQREEARALLLQLAEKALSSGRAEDEFMVESLPWFFVQVDDIASATRLQRQCFENACWFATFPLIGNRFGIALPEEVSDDPQWLALWDDPRLADLMAEFRRNVGAWRAEQR